MCPKLDMSQNQMYLKLYVSQNEVCPRMKCVQQTKVSQNQKCPKIKSVPSSNMSQNQMFHKIKCVTQLKVSQNQKCPRNQVDQNQVS